MASHFTSQLTPDYVSLTEPPLQPCPAPAVSPRLMSEERTRAWLRACRDIVGLGDAWVSMSKHVPCPQCPQHQVLAQADGLVSQSQPLPANTTQLPQLFPIVQMPEPCQRCSPGRSLAATHGQTVTQSSPASYLHRCRLDLRTLSLRAGPQHYTHLL